jgi:hypothetical protein
MDLFREYESIIILPSFRRHFIWQLQAGTLTSPIGWWTSWAATRARPPREAAAPRAWPEMAATLKWWPRLEKLRELLLAFAYVRWPRKDLECSERNTFYFMAIH